MLKTLQIGAEILMKYGKSRFLIENAFLAYR